MSQTLVGDLGGTNTRFAISVDGEADLKHVKQFRNAGFQDFEDVLSLYLSELGSPELSGVCIAAAGPVSQGELRMTNIAWVISVAGLRKRLGVETALLINDLQAFGYALEVLGSEDLVPVCNASAKTLPMGQKLIVNLGTGFNISVTTTSVGGKVLALRSETGHAYPLLREPLPAHLVGHGQGPAGAEVEVVGTLLPGGLLGDPLIVGMARNHDLQIGGLGRLEHPDQLA